MTNLEKQPKQLSDKPKFPRCSFLTASLVDEIDKDSSGKEFHIARQGVYFGNFNDGNILIQSESGTFYRCLPDATRVPDENLYGSTKKFVKKLRKSIK